MKKLLSIFAVMSIIIMAGLNMNAHAQIGPANSVTLTQEVSSAIGAIHGESAHVILNTINNTSLSPVFIPEGSTLTIPSTIQVTSLDISVPSSWGGTFHYSFIDLSSVSNNGYSTYTNNIFLGTPGGLGGTTVMGTLYIKKTNDRNSFSFYFTQFAAF